MVLGSGTDLHFVSRVSGVVIDCEGKGPAFVLRTKFETLVKSTCRAYADARRPGGSQDTSDRNHLLGIHETESQEDACREDLVALVTMTMANCNSPSNGGALLVEAPVMSRVLVKDCVFVNNSARGFGGAVAVKGRDVTFEGCLFRNNSGGAGGGGRVRRRGVDVGIFAVVSVGRVFQMARCAMHGGLERSGIGVRRGQLCALICCR